MDVQVTWQQGLSFNAKADSGFEVQLGASREVGGDEDGFRPLELMAISLAGCTAMDVVSILSKKRQDVTSFNVHVHADRADEHPKVFTSTTITYVISGHGVDEAALIRALELSATKYCPAQAMLAKVVPMQLKYEIFEESATGGKTLVKQGVYQSG